LCQSAFEPTKMNPRIVDQRAPPDVQEPAVAHEDEQRGAAQLAPAVVRPLEEGDAVFAVRDLKLVLLDPGKGAERWAGSGPAA